MNEDYVSLEVAKLLKEKGFDSHYSTHFYKNNKLECYMDDRKKYWLQKDEYAAPSLYIAQKWLRETKGIYIWVEPVVGRKWTTSSCDFNVSLEESNWIERELHKDGYHIYEDYTEALQTGILEALKLII